MSTKNDISEKILTAMSIVAGKQINSVSFDETILCTIEDNTDKDKGKYIVHYQNASFPAYSQTTNYTNGTKVYVTVPNGDWNQQKIIIGKYTSDNMTPFVFAYPFDSMFDMTGNLASTDEEDVAVGILLANSPKEHSRLSNGNFEMIGSSTKTSFANEITTQKSSEDYDNDMTTFYFNKSDLDNQFYSHVFLNSFDIANELDELQKQGFAKVKEPASGMDMLGIQADFTSWASDAVVGDYGIAVQVAFRQPDTVEYKDKTNEDTKNVKDYDVKTNPKTIIYTFILSNKDMYGNPYNFENNYTQQQVYPIKDLGTITHLRIVFYQDGNFRDIDGNRVSVLNSDFAKQSSGPYDITDLLLENLFVRNVYICAGCELKTLDDDKLEIYSNSGMTYNKKLNNVNGNNKNIKEINTRWVHLLEDKTPIDVVHGTQKYLDHFNLHWFQYDVSNTSVDPRLGPFWKEVKTFNYDVNNLPDDFDYLEMFKYELIPDINKQQEKMILMIEIDNSWYRSNILYFDNEEIVPNDDTLRYENAIDIVAEDGTFGNYFVYSENSELQENEFANELRYMYVVFDNDEDGVIDIEKDRLDEGGLNSETGVYDFGDYKNVIWTLPLNQDSMLQFYFDDLTEATYSSNSSFTCGSYYVDEARRKVYVPYRTCPKYRLSGHYYPNKTENTVACSFELNGRLYKTEKEYTFGYTGTMGTDQTIVIDFAECSDDGKFYSSDRNAVYLDDSKDIYLRLRLMDETATIINLDNQENLNITWFWAATSYVDEDNQIHCYLDYNGKNISKSPIENKNEGLIIDDIHAYGLTIEPIENNKQYVKITRNKNFNMNQLYVVGVKIETENNNASFNLITHFGIPVALNKTYSHISGPTKVNYLTNGQPYYYNVPYKLFEYVTDKNEKPWIGKVAKEIDPDKICWEITQGDEFKGHLQSERLSPYPIYIENAWLYGVNCVDEIAPSEDPGTTYDVDIQADLSNSTGKIYWTQPIPVFINRYPSGTLNKWNGRDIEIDNKNATIIARGMAAGKKEPEDNTFTGTIIGDWSYKSDEPFISHTGVYGIYHGQMCYQLTDDGIAKFGRSGLGQIIIDGNQGVIQSSDYVVNHQGMKIDLGRDINDANYKNGQGYPYIEMIDHSDRILLKAEAQNSMIQLSGLIVDKDSYNNIFEDDAIISQGTGSITLTNNTNEHPLSISINSNDSNIKSGNQFYVDWDGYLFSNTGQIGGWYIDEHTISANVYSKESSTENLNDKKSRKNEFSTLVLDDDGIIRIGKKQYKVDKSNGRVNRKVISDNDSYKNSIVIDGSTDAAYMAINLSSLSDCTQSGIYIKPDEITLNSEEVAAIALAETKKQRTVGEDLQDCLGPIYILDPTDTSSDTIMGAVGVITGADDKGQTVNVGIVTSNYANTSSGKYKTNPSIILSSSRNVKLSTSNFPADSTDNEGDHIYLQTSGSKYSTINMYAQKIIMGTNGGNDAAQIKSFMFNGTEIIGPSGKPMAYFA